MSIEYKDLRKLNNEEIKIVKDICEREYKKISRRLGMIVKLVLDVVKYQKEGKRAKYSFHAKLYSPNLKMAVSRSSDWDVARAVHKVLKNLENVKKKKFKTDVSYKKSYF